MNPAPLLGGASCLLVEVVFFPTVITIQAITVPPVKQCSPQLIMILRTYCSQSPFLSSLPWEGLEESMQQINPLIAFSQHFCSSWKPSAPVQQHSLIQLSLRRRSALREGSIRNIFVPHGGKKNPEPHLDMFLKN